MIVVDASALVEVLIRAPAADAVLERLARAGETLHAPHLIDVEAAHAIRRLAALGAFDDERGGLALADLSDFPLHRHAHHPLTPRVWTLRHNLSAYDATYVALAEALDAPLLTLDRRLANATGHDARIETP